MKILFLSANPVNVATRLRPEVEFREIVEKIRLSTCRHKVELVPELAVRAQDLQAALLRHKPDIVHFSGHCSPSGEIILEDEAGRRKMIPVGAFAGMFCKLRDRVRVAVINACHATENARALTEAVDFAVGMNSEIDDKSAIIFSSHFYQYLAFGESVQESFELAVNQIGLDGGDRADRPELFARPGSSPQEAVILARSDNDAASSSTEEGTTGVRRILTRLARRRPLVLLNWFFATAAASLFADIGRRFLDDGWLEITVGIVEGFFLAASVVAAALLAISLARAHTSPLKPSRGSRKPAWAVTFTGTALVVVLCAWLSLPALAQHYNERGSQLQYRDQPDLPAARQSYQLAVRLNPKYAEGHYNLAAALEDFQPETAIEEYLLAIKHDVDIYPAYNNLARLYLKRGRDGDYESALALLNSALDLAPPDDRAAYSLYKNLGWASYALKQYSLAESQLRRAISLQGKQGAAAAHCLLALVLRERGKPGVEDECFDCVSLAPGERDVEAWWLSNAKETLLLRGNQ